MDQISDTLNKFANLVEKDIKGVHVSSINNTNQYDNFLLMDMFQIGCYSVALIGLTVAIRKVRPVSIFNLHLTYLLKYCI